MFLTVIEWLAPVAGGLLIGLLYATRKTVDPSQLIMLDVEDFRLNMRKGQLIDIRSEADFLQKHISGARNFPKKSIVSNLSKLRADQAVFIVGYPPKAATYSLAKKLYKKGLHPIYILKHGLDDWKYPLKEE